MAQQAKAPPKWGDWGGQDVEYTEFFERERRGREPKARQTVVDPNDPRRNPYAALASSQTKVPVNGIPAKDPRRDGDFLASKTPPRARMRMSYSGERSGGDHSHKRGGRRASFDSISHSNASSPWQQLTVRPAKGQHPDAKAPSAPPFGGWKGNSTAEQRSVAPEDFSVIFERLKEEKDWAGAAPRPLNVSKRPAKDERSDEETPVATSTKFKWCCFAA